MTEMFLFMMTTMTSFILLGMKNTMTGGIRKNLKDYMA